MLLCLASEVKLGLYDIIVNLAIRKKLPDIFERWIEFTFIVESFYEEISNTLNITIKVPITKQNIYYSAANVYY